MCIFRQRKKYAVNNALITSLVSMNKTLTEIIQIKYWGAGCCHSPQIMKVFTLISYFPVKRFVKVRNMIREKLSLFFLPLVPKTKENDKFRVCWTCLPSDSLNYSPSCMNFSVSLQISGSIWMQTCVQSSCSIFIKNQLCYSYLWGQTLSIW